MTVTRLRRHWLLVCAALTALSGVVALGPASPVRAASPAAASDTWPMFGHDQLHSGVSPDTTIGATTAAGLSKRWSQPLGSVSDQPSPVVAYSAARKQTLVYDVTYPGVVSAFNATTGALAWRRNVGAHVLSTPAVYGNTVYFGDNKGVLEALNAATGAVQCTFTMPIIPPATQPGHIISAPAVGNVDGTGATVFFGDVGAGSPKGTELDNGGYLWAVTGVGNTAGSCKLKWDYNNWPLKGKSGTMTGVWDPLALAQESDGTWAVVFGTSNPDNAVYALNAVTGSLVWRFRTAQTGPDQDVGAGPTISAPGGNGFADGVVYIEGKDGIEYALDLRTGTKIWSFTLGSPTVAVSEAALAGNILTLGFAGSVFGLNATTGVPIWQATPGGTIVASPAVSGSPGSQALFIGDTDGHEYGLSLATGTQLFSATPKGKVEASSAVANGMLYFAANGTLYAYAPAG
jgi:eukaryotic-like serine/threonine-protein kinase